MEDIGKYSHPKCWAKSLNSCSEKISREHIVSENQFESQIVTVSGFRGGASWTEIGGPTTKNLCETHNAFLGGDIDPCILKFKSMIKRIINHGKLSKLTKGDKNFILKLEIDGNHLLKWCVKTVINFIHANSSGAEVPLSIVKYIFSNDIKPDTLGIYSKFSIGENLDIDQDRFDFRARFDEDTGSLLCAALNIRGWPMIVEFTETQQWHKNNGNMRVNGMAYNVGGSKCANIKFKW